MREDRLDCTWCGSAMSIDHGICQVCLMEYPLETKVIQLPLARWERYPAPDTRVRELDLKQTDARPS